MIATFLFLAALPPQQSPPASGLEARVSFKVEAGPLFPSLESIERQSGLSFSVLPELLPPDLKGSALTHDGLVAAGIDKIFKALQLKWEIGELGGVVVLPASLPKISSLRDWLSAEFDDQRGMELVEIVPDGEKLGFRNGDVVIAMNGEKFPSVYDFHQAVMKNVKEGDTVTFSVRRGKEVLQIKVNIHTKNFWRANCMGVYRVADAPSYWVQYQKAGHRDPKWDEHFKAAFDEHRKGERTFSPFKLLEHVESCWKLGSRDPLLVEMVRSKVADFSASRWEAVTRAHDSERLRTVYGGSRLYSRLESSTLFSQQGPPSVRRAARREVEAGWTALRGSSNDALKRSLGQALALQRFMEGDYEGCVRLMTQIQPLFKDEIHYTPVGLHVQALARLGRFSEAAKALDVYFPGEFKNRGEGYRQLLQLAQEQLSTKGPGPSECIQGPAGLISWKNWTAMDTLQAGVRKDPLPGHRPLQDTRGNYMVKFPFLVAPETVEVHFFTSILKEYEAGAWTGAVFNAGKDVPPGGKVDEQAWYDGAWFTIGHNLTLFHRQKNVSGSAWFPLPGFSNSFQDAITLYKTPRLASVRTNGVWTYTGSGPALASRSHLVFPVFMTVGAADFGIFVPTREFHDNDAIRDRMERLIDPTTTLSPEERLKLWHEAEALAPSDNTWKGMGQFLPDSLKNLAKPPSPGPPSKAALTFDEAKARLVQRGEARWVLPDAEDKDLVWCARPDGRLEALSRERYFTTFHSFLPEFTGKAVAAGTPVFEKESVWIPTDHGLFGYNRKSGSMRRIAIGNVLQDVSISNLSVKLGILTFETSGTKWKLDPKSGRWSRG